MLSPGERAQADVCGVWGRRLCAALSWRRLFLPLLQMSESETLISMVNRMVGNSSPRAQLFMQVRPLPGSMVPASTISAARVAESPPLGRGLRCLTCSLARPHLPGLAWSPSLNSAVSPPFFTFMGEPETHFANHQSSTNISCHAGGHRSASSCPGCPSHIWCLLNRCWG